MRASGGKLRGYIISLLSLASYHTMATEAVLLLKVKETAQNSSDTRRRQHGYLEIRHKSIERGRHGGEGTIDAWLRSVTEYVRGQALGAQIEHVVNA